MNKTHRIVWSAVRQAYIVTHEHATTHGKPASTRAAAVFVAAALLSGGVLAASAPTAVDLDGFFNGAGITTQNGGAKGGCMIGVSIAGCSAAPKTENVTYTNYYTKGGDGSGGGAGLGGVFFVEKDKNLTLTNVQFAGNVVKGGTGGGTPDVRVQSADITLVQRQANVVAFSAFNTIPKVDSDGKSITTINMGENATPLQVGQLVTLDGTTGTAKVASVSADGKTITLDKALTLSDQAIKTVSGSLTIANDGSNAKITGQALTNLGAGGRIEMGAIISGVAGIPDGTMVTDVKRDSENKITEVILNKPVNVTLNPGALTFISTPKLNTSQFVVDATDRKSITLAGADQNLSVGMTLKGKNSGGQEVVLGKVLAIDAATGKVTLDQDMPDGVLGFSSKSEIGKQGTNIITLASPDGRIQVGGVISGAGIPAGTVVTAYDKDTGKVTLSQNLTQDLTDKTNIVASSVKSQAGGAITLASVAGLKAGMTVTGTGIPEGAKIVSINSSTNTVIFDKTPTGAVLDFVATSPLNVGGSLNNLQASGKGPDGGNGQSGSSVLPYITDGEGKVGLSGESANKGTPVAGSQGGRGGNGGDGSSGVSYNFDLAADVALKTVAVVTSSAEAGAAFSNAPFPDFAEGAVLTANAIAAGVDLALSIKNQGIWVAQLSKGTVALGGSGGNGGRGGDGSEFFGGGSGGNGGNGGNGGKSYIEGGAGGSGGAGGDGGFGAGGGSGGKGGAAGSTGYAQAGDAGDGGVAGFGAGQGSDGKNRFGGGGSGYGGAIFVREGGSLSINGNALFRNNVALGGSSTNRGEAGQAAGADIFVMKGGSVTLSPGQGNTIRIEGGIADDSAGSIDGASYASGDGADVRIAGGGLVQFAGTNTYTGKTIIAGGTLEATLGEGIHSDSSIVFNGTGTSQPHQSAGVLLLSEDVTKKVGSIVPGEISWDGAGGFASGRAEGIRLNFGLTANAADKGQTLVWGSDALKTNSTLVFGSEYGLGSVEWMNAIDMNGNTGKVVVFDSQQLVDGKKVDDVAYMRGTLSNGNLEVGDTGYTGTLFLTGQNSLTELTVHEGTVRTGDGKTSGKLSATGSTKVTVKDGGSLLLASAENAAAVTVDKGGVLGTQQGAALTATDVNNQGTLLLGDKATLTSLNNAADALLSNMDTVTVSGALVNNGTLLQGSMSTGEGLLVSDNANISAKTVTNNKDWVVVGTQQIKAETLDGNGKFVLENLTLEGKPKQAVLTLDQSGNSTFAGIFTGAGALDKTGAGTLTLTGASTATGGLTVKQGTVDTTGGGTLADTGAITIEKDGTFIAGTADTVGAVSNSGSYTVNAAQTVASLSNTGTGMSTLNADLTSTSTVSNAASGTINQQADITATGKVSNDGTLNISGERTITTAGLEGAATGVVNVADKLTLAQKGNSTYAGQINGAGALDKTEAGKLTLTGANGFIGGLTVKAGAIDTTGGGTLSDTGTITIEQGAGFVAGTADTVGVVSNSGSYSVNAAQTVASLSNTGTGVSTLAANLVSNDTVTNAAGGKIEQQANITATSTVTNDGLIEVTGNRITTSGGYHGSGETNLAEAAKLTISQDKDSLYSGAFTGKGALDKTGTGKLTLTGANTATGGLTVKQGTVDTTGGGTLADSGAITVDAGATFVAGTADTVGAVSNNGSYLVNAEQTVASLSNTGTGTSTLNAKLTSTSTVSNAVGGMINQQADITAAGKLTNDGTLNISGDRTITTAGLAGAASGRVNVDSKLTLIQSSDSAYAGQINGAGAMDKTGAGKLTLTGANGFAGGLTVKAGAIDTTGGGTLFDTGTITIEQGASFIAGTADTVGAVVNSGSYQVAAAQTVASLINTGTGVGTLLADLISQSAVENQAGGTLKQQTNITATGKVSNDGLIEVTGKQTTTSGGYQGSGETRLAEAAKLTIAQAADSTYSGRFTGAGALDKTGAGKLTLTGANAASGGLTVKQGTVDTTGGGTLADTGAITVEKGATFVAGTADTVGVVTNSGSYQVNAAQTVASLNNTGTTTLNANLTATGQVSNDGTLDIIGDRTISTAGLAGAATGIVNVTDKLTLAQSGVSTYAGKIAGEGTVQKTGDGTLTLNGTAGSFNAKNLIVDQGTVALEGEYLLAERVGVTVNSSADKVGTLSLVQGDQRITNLSGAGNVALGNNRLTVLGKSAFTGKVSGTGVLDIREGAFEVKDSLTSSDPNSVFNVGSATGNGNTASSAVVTVSKDSTLAFPKVDLQSGSTLAVKENGKVQAGNINLGEQTLLEVATTGQVNTGAGGQLTLNGEKAHLLVQQGASVTSPTVTVSAAGSRVDVVGNLQASNLNINTSAQKREDAAVLHLGQVGGGVAGAVNAGQTSVSGGVVSGAGKLSGSLSMGKNSWLSPGNSPGKLSLGNLNLQGGSVAELEVGATGAGARVAGVDYDQIVVDGDLTISGDAQLQLKSYQGGTLAAGEALQLFAVQPGKVSGQFGSVLNAGIGNALFSLGTGSVVGLGAGGYAGFAKQVIRDDNQRQILGDLLVSEAGGVQQFYGGKLLQRLAAASAAGADTDAIFDRFSPEVYASLLDQAKSSALYAAPDVYDDLQKGARGVSASYFSRQQETGDDAGYQSYDLNSSGLRIGYVDQFGGDVTWRGNFTVERNKVGSQYFNADGDGLAAGLQLAKPVFANGNGYLTGRVGFGAQNNDVTRQTNDGKAEVNNLNSSAWLLGLGVAHVGKVADLRLQSAAEVIGYQARVDALSEQNVASPSDALSVDAQKQSGAAVQLSASLSGAVTEKLDLSFGGRLTHFDKDGYDLSAQLNTEQQGFSVRAKGLDATQFSLDAGLNYKATPFDHIAAKVQAFEQGGYQANLTYSRLF